MGTDLQRVSSVMADFEKAVKQSLPEPKPDKSHLTLGENIATKTALTVVRVDFFFLSRPSVSVDVSFSVFVLVGVCCVD